MNRGEGREPIFLDDEDRRLFLETLGEASQKAGWQAKFESRNSKQFHSVQIKSAESHPNSLNRRKRTVSNTFSPWYRYIAFCENLKKRQRCILNHIFEPLDFGMPLKLNSITTIFRIQEIQRFNRRHKFFGHLFSGP